MQIPSHYLVYARHTDGTVTTYGDIYRHFNDAADGYAEAMGEDWITDARVVFFPEIGGATKDVTENARAKVAEWLVNTGRDLPAWLSDEPPVCADCGHERCTCDDAYEARKADAA